MIVKILMTDAEGESFTMLFGTSYKNYLTQIQDFFYRSQKWVDRCAYPVYSILSIEASKSKWKGWGGLKWCLEEDFQQELNREGCQQGEPDNPKPRQYSQMKFEKNYHVSVKIETWFNNQYKEREIVSIN